MRSAAKMKELVRSYLTRYEHLTSKHAASLIHITPETAYRYLSELCEDGVAHRTRTHNPKGPAAVTFNLGPEPVDSFDHRATVKTWAPLRVSDPWMLPREFFQPTGIHA